MFEIGVDSSAVIGMPRSNLLTKGRVDSLYGTTSLKADALHGPVWSILR